jgi:hypothetical protein
VLLCHGFLANEKMCHGYARLLAELGYVAFTFDFSGGGLGCRSDGASECMTLSTEVADLHAVLHYAESQPFVDARHISLLGCSQGGVVAAMLARTIPDKVEKLLLLYPALCIPDDARRGKMMFYRFDPQHIPDLLGRFPMKLGGNYAREVLNTDIYAAITGYSGPVLYLQGTEDSIVDVAYARKGKEVFPQCHYVEIAGGGHMFRGAAEKEARQSIASFMARPCE